MLLALHLLLYSTPSHYTIPPHQSPKHTGKAHPSLEYGEVEEVKGPTPIQWGKGEAHKYSSGSITWYTIPHYTKYHNTVFCTYYSYYLLAVWSWELFHVPMFSFLLWVINNKLNPYQRVKMSLYGLEHGKHLEQTILFNKGDRHLWVLPTGQLFPSLRGRRVWWEEGGTDQWAHSSWSRPIALIYIFPLSQGYSFLCQLQALHLFFFFF